MLSAAAPGRPKLKIGGNRRPQGGTLTRFVGTAAHALRGDAALPARHPAVVNGRTLFPSQVKAVEDVPRLLVSGHNSAKIGARVLKGAWRGLPIFTLTLEERATCPRSCHLWAECYGNAMPFSRRPAAGPELIDRLADELHALTRLYPRGIAVRLHVLGDFWSLEYVQAWERWTRRHPGLHVFGFTAHANTTALGAAIAEMNIAYPNRWAIRFSVAGAATGGGMQATTIWRKPEGGGRG